MCCFVAKDSEGKIACANNLKGNVKKWGKERIQTIVWSSVTSAVWIPYLSDQEEDNIFCSTSMTSSMRDPEA